MLPRCTSATALRQLGASGSRSRMALYSASTRYSESPRRWAACTARSPSRRPELRTHHHVVIVIRDVRHVGERLPHALAEGVDRRAKRIF